MAAPLAAALIHNVGREKIKKEKEVKQNAWQSCGGGRIKWPFKSKREKEQKCG